jgi:hypothetical protein
MTSRLAKASLLAVTILATAGCRTTAPANAGYGGSVYAPYSAGSNSACGALGNCPVTNPIQIYPGDEHANF